MVKFLESTERVKELVQALRDKALGDRSGEWFQQNDFADIAELYKDKPVIVRKAYGIREMLAKMTNEKISEHTHTYEIQSGELIVGVIPMGSNGLGKVFPNYLTSDEKRSASYTNKSELSLLGHNTINYDRLLKGGLNAIIADAKKRMSDTEEKLKSAGIPEGAYKISIMESTENIEKIRKNNRLVTKKEFYESVIISCEAVIFYANQFSKLAEKMASEEEDQVRRNELLEIARICKRVPAEKPDNFYEALQSIYFFHTALHASMNFISLGRLDQVLNRYLQRDIDKLSSEAEKNTVIEKATELFECFLVKAAGRLNLTTEYLLKQDHMDNNAALGVHPYYLDQRAGVNNFLQNIIIGGMKPDGTQADNPMTYLILNAFANVNLATPGIYVRMGKNSREELKEAVAMCLEKTKNIPGVLNDDVLIPALLESFLADVPEEKMEEEKNKYMPLIYDYCVDGCWEPILNGECDWTFGMPSCLTVYQCAINQGAVLDTNIGMLRGSKISFRSPQVTSYEEMKESFQQYMQFFIDQSAFGFYNCYTMDEFVTPSPLLSAVLGKCMEKGRDKSWGGAGINIAGNILTGVPDTINNIAAIKKFVFEDKKYTLEEVKEAMVNDFTAPLSSAVGKQIQWNDMKHDFDFNCPKFGDGSKEIEEIGQFVIHTFCDAVKASKKFTDKVFLNSIKDKSEAEKNNIRRLRKIAGYSGSCFKRRFGTDFDFKFTTGCGTFEQYPQQGLGVVATANRESNDPIIANFSPAPGTVTRGVANVFKTMGQLPMNRMSAGAITDLCMSADSCTMGDIKAVLDGFIDYKGCMLTLAFGNVKTFQRIYSLSKAAIYGDEAEKEYAEKELAQYKDIVVRVGGWQAPFVSMSLAQQENYILRILENE